MSVKNLNIKKNLEKIREQIEISAQKAERKSTDIRLVAVSKNQTVGRIQEVIDAGLITFGENYAELGVPKIEAIGREDIEWHMIGHVQSRKSALVAEYFSVLHSLDRVKIAKRLNRQLLETGKIMPVFLEMNVSGEESKFGFPAWNQDQWENLLPQLALLDQCKNLRVTGLMTIAPWGTSGEGARPTFAKLRRLRAFLTSNFTHWELDELSMGMSGDFGAAIEEGATYIRIGTAIFGPNDQAG